MKVLYIHGYNGSPQGHSYSLLRKFLPDDIMISGMDYCQDDCKVALKQIRETVEKEGFDVVVGSSLGGFLALLVAGVERYVINPCYRPSVELPKLGPQNGLPAPSPDMIATYACYEDGLADLVRQDSDNIHCLMADKDELLGFRYYEEIARDMGKSPRIIFSGHHLSESAARTVSCLISKKSGAVLKDAHKYSSGNMSMVKMSEKCGCFSCRRIFSASEVEYYSGDAAECPYCGIDSVLPDACPYDINEDFMKKMHVRWF